MSAADIFSKESVRECGSKSSREIMSKTKRRIFKAVHITKKGKRIPVENFFEFNGEKVIISVARDITERLKADEEIRNRMKELEKFSKSMVGRELKMVELKKRINELRAKLGMKPKYKMQ